MIDWLERKVMTTWAGAFGMALLLFSAAYKGLEAGEKLAGVMFR